MLDASVVGVVSIYISRIECRVDRPLNTHYVMKSQLLWTYFRHHFGLSLQSYITFSPKVHHLHGIIKPRQDKQQLVIFLGRFMSSCAASIILCFITFLCRRVWSHKHPFTFLCLTFLNIPTFPFLDPPINPYYFTCLLTLVLRRRVAQLILLTNKFLKLIVY